MRAGLYSPYLDTLGGGERYILTIAEYLSKNHEVEILLDSHLHKLHPQKIITESSNRFDLDLSKVKLVKAPLGRGSSLLKRSFFLKQYDFLFYLTDGSIFYSTAKNSIIHFQAPLPNHNQGMWGRKKISSWDLGICNSVFTEKVIQKNWPIKTMVVYPPVDTLKIRPLKKKKQILSAGRLLGFKKPKKHQALIDAFIKMSDAGLMDGWSLHIAGYISSGEIKDLKKIQKDLKKYSIFFYPNYPYLKLVKLYGESSIYWHATGLGEEDPINMEHFGITTVEAMAGGAVPIVINKGGQREIVEDKVSGFLWNDVEELIKLTQNLTSNNSLLKQISQKATARSKIFSKEKFCENIQNLINDH